MSDKGPITSNPLCWPAGWPRTPRSDRKRARYELSLSASVDDLLHELRLLGGYGVILSSNLEVKKDGLPYADSHEPVDPGVAVYWTQRGPQRSNLQRVMASDKWLRARDNVRAVGLSIGHLRGLERCGTSAIMERAFLGFAALPASTWRTQLGFEADKPIAAISVDDIERAFHARIHEAHPDKPNGSHEAFVALEQAHREALEEYERQFNGRGATP